ncbi:SET and MYND domain-containing protein 4-like [Trichogramma pretiosum]|uniref:SET and MYND domain-containing protein 4-like n=1 Tax=Trichogramma pretiosum TaxID=7493 RepID=UPI000C71AE6C|nr:SET and MYND domain-containing protein 4-like [Trichogramma pretiosum]
MFAQVRLMISGRFQKFYEKLLLDDDPGHRVRSALESLEDILPLDEVACDTKNAALSASLRREGDELFLAERASLVGLLQAWEYYCKAVALAPCTDQDASLPLAYANRSACLFHLKRYAECAADCDKALRELSYPDSMRPNLLRRKAKCLKILDQTTSAAAAASSLPGMTANRKIPCASEAVEIRYNKRYGRHVVASRDIEIGEVLALEPPYALQLGTACLYTHCSHCLARAWASWPCPGCAFAVYCSAGCRDEAWHAYHDVECAVRGYLLKLNVNDIAPFSLKVAILAIRQAGGFRQLREQLRRIEESEDPLKKSFTDGLYRSDLYRTFYHLESHEDKILLKELITILLNTALILYYVSTKTSFIEDLTNESSRDLCSSDDALLMGKLIAHHFMVIQMNDQELFEITLRGQNHSLGAAVFPFCSLFNHSCFPNATRIPIVGDDKKMHQLMIAQHPIKKGSQIFDDYGFDFIAGTVAHRKNLCKKYFFTCECEPCLDYWPEFKYLPTIFTMPTFQSTSKEKRLELKKALNNFASYEKIIIQADIKKLTENKKLLTTLAKSLTTIFENSPKITKETFRSVVLYKQAFLLIHGNRFNV